jgi:transposase InsO family protein
LTADIIELASQYGRYGYRNIAALLRHAGWLVNDKRVERIWRREGLKVPYKQPRRRRLWLTDASCPGSPWENGYVESFNARLRDELLNCEVFYSLREAQIVIESWRRHYNAAARVARYKPPVPEVFVPALAAWPYSRAAPAPSSTQPN